MWEFILDSCFVQTTIPSINSIFMATHFVLYTFGVSIRLWKFFYNLIRGQFLGVNQSTIYCSSTSVHVHATATLMNGNYFKYNITNKIERWVIFPHQPNYMYITYIKYKIWFVYIMNYIYSI